jgi:hypothetical protein
MFQFVNKYFDRLKLLFNKEVELVKLKALKGLADFFSHAFLLIFITIFINTLVIVGSIWLGFVLGEIFDSMTIGFGLVTLLVFLLFILIIIFRKAFIINPFRNGMMAFYLSQEEAQAKKKKDNEVIESSDTSRT